MSIDLQDVANDCTRLMSRLDRVTHNVANVNTVGFKEVYLQLIAQGSASDPSNDQQPSDYTENVFLKMEQGTIQQTGNVLDAAINGNGFFVIQTPEGPLYTRKGDFQLSSKNELTTAAGAPVLGENGPLTLNGKIVSIDPQGTIAVDGVKVGKLKIVDFEKPSLLTQAGGSMYKDPGNAGLKENKNPQIVPRALEQSNVNALQQMASMIEIQRSLEIYQKLIQAMSDEDKTSTTRIGKLL